MTKFKAVFAELPKDAQDLVERVDTVVYETAPQACYALARLTKKVAYGH